MMDALDAAAAAPDEEVDLEIDDLEDGVLDPANDGTVVDVVLYRGAWYVSPLNARQEAGAAILYVGVVNRLNDGGERLVVNYLPSRSQGERFSFADNLSRASPVSALACYMGFAEASRGEAGSVLHDGHDWRHPLGYALLIPQQMVMRHSHGPRQVWDGATNDTVRRRCGWHAPSWRTYLEPRLSVVWVPAVDESAAGHLSRAALPQVVGNDRIHLYGDANLYGRGGVGPGSVPWFEPYEPVFHRYTSGGRATLNFYADDAVLVTGAASATHARPVRRLLDLLDLMSEVGRGARDEDEEDLPEQ